MTPQDARPTPTRARHRKGVRWLQAVGITLAGWLVLGAIGVGAPLLAGGQSPFSVGVESVTEFRSVCQAATFPRAAAFDPADKPYQVAGFQRTEPDRYVDMFLGSDRDFVSREPAEVTVAACLSPVRRTAETVTTCRVTHEGDEVTAKVQRVEYSVTYRSVRTGEQVGSGENVSSTDDATCDARSEVDPDDPVIYWPPDVDEAENEIARFAE